MSFVGYGSKKSHELPVFHDFHSPLETLSTADASIANRCKQTGRD